MLKGVVPALALSMVIAMPAIAGVEIKPQAESNQVVRFDRGVPTVEEDLPDQQAAVRVVPLPGLDHGSLTFKVAVYNKSHQPFNFGVENIAFDHGDEHLAVFTKDELEKRAKSRAMWSQIGYAMLAATAAAAQNNNTSITTYTPRGGVYRTVINRPGLSDGQLASAAAGGGAIALSQIGLQKTLDSLNNEIIQLTTLDPDSGYGGRIVCSKLKKVAVGDVVLLTVSINGEKHLFKFVVDKV
jgi:hypothetical protein